jgi:hypothetical protein
LLAGLAGLVQDRGALGSGRVGGEEAGRQDEMAVADDDDLERAMLETIGRGRHGRQAERQGRSSGGKQRAPRQHGASLKHESEKRIPVFGQDHV